MKLGLIKILKQLSFLLSELFEIGVHSMQSGTATTLQGVTKKKEAQKD